MRMFDFEKPKVPGTVGINDVVNKKLPEDVTVKGTAAGSEYRKDELLSDQEEGLDKFPPGYFDNIKEKQRLYNLEHNLPSPDRANRPNGSLTEGNTTQSSLPGDATKFPSGWFRDDIKESNAALMMGMKRDRSTPLKKNRIAD